MGNGVSETSSSDGIMEVSCCFNNFSSTSELESDDVVESEDDVDKFLYLLISGYWGIKMILLSSFDTSGT